MYEITSRDVTTKDYLIPYVFTGSSQRKEVDISEIVNWSFSISMGQELPRKLFYPSLLYSFEIDSSSVYPYFSSESKTSLTEEPYEEIPYEEMLEYNLIFRMPPVKEYTVWIEVKNVEKATPRFVEPDRF